MYDVVVVGARVAGASTALLFAKAGYEVLLVDRARFPSDKMSTLYIHQPGIARLARWGVLDAVRATGAPALDHVIYQVGDDIRLEGCSLPAEGHHTAAYAPRRYLLDQILIEAAVAAGVEFREGSSIAGPSFDDDGRVNGVEFRSARGGSLREHAHLTVGADGMRSVFARGVGARYTIRDPLRTCGYYTYWTGLDADFELYERPGNWIGAVPTNDGATLIASYSPQSDFDRVRADPLAHYLASLRTTAPDLHDRAMAGERVDKLQGTGDQQNFFRQSTGPGWALVGDAAHNKDSITARGISDAFLQAELLVTTVGSGLHDRARLAATLEQYAEDAQDELFEAYRNTLNIGLLDPGPDRLEMLRVVAASPTLTARYFAATSGVLPVGDFYDDELHLALTA
jgi:flavin-dependent dehydrogenase